MRTRQRLRTAEPNTEAENIELEILDKNEEEGNKLDIDESDIEITTSI